MGGSVRGEVRCREEDDERLGEGRVVDDEVGVGRETSEEGEVGRAEDDRERPVA